MRASFLCARVRVCLCVPWKHSHRRAVTSVPVSHTKQLAKQCAHTHTHIAHVYAHANPSIHLLLYKHAHTWKRMTLASIYPLDKHTHTHFVSHFVSVSRLLFFVPSCLVLYCLFPFCLFLSLRPHLLSCHPWIMYCILMEWETLAWGYRSPLNDY